MSLRGSGVEAEAHSSACELSRPESRLDVEAERVRMGVRKSGHAQAVVSSFGRQVAPFKRGFLLSAIILRLPVLKSIPTQKT
jgi:hypothetical protein